MSNRNERIIDYLEKAIEYGEIAKSSLQEAQQGTFLSRAVFLILGIGALVWRRIYIVAILQDDETCISCYDRDAAATYAINESQLNFTGFPVTVGAIDAADDPFHGRVSTQLEPRDYSCYLTHRSGSTGSSTWISEVLHFGGKIPMTLPPSLDSELCGSDLGGITEVGWKTCSVDMENDCQPDESATKTWRDHVGILRYFQSLPRAYQTCPDDALFFLGSIDPINDDVRDQAVYFNDIETGVAGNIRTDGATDGATILETLFNGQNNDLDKIQQGDYMFVCLQDNDSTGVNCLDITTEEKTSNHGFIVVGWGPILNTLQALNYTDLSPYRNPFEEHFVPYIADFCFGTGDGSDEDEEALTDFNTGWLQDPRPRPFYASAVEMGDSVLQYYVQFHPNELSVIEYKSHLRQRIFRPFTKKNNPNDERPIWEFYRIPNLIMLFRSRIYGTPPVDCDCDC